MKASLIFLAGLGIGLLAYFGYQILKPEPITQNENTFVTPNPNETSNTTIPVGTNTPVNNTDSVYKITFNDMTEKEIWQIRSEESYKPAQESDRSDFPQMFIVNLFQMNDLKGKDLETLEKLIQVKNTSSYFDPVEYYLWTDKSVSKIDTTKKYTYKNLTASISPANLSFKPYIFSNTYCEKTSDCRTHGGSFCSVYPDNTFTGLTTLFGCVVAFYPNETEANLKAQEQKCPTDPSKAENFQITYTKSACVQNRCVPTEKQVSCI